MSDDESGTETDEAGGARAMLELVRCVAVELHPARERTLSVALDSVLDRDLGFDSLSRVELIHRIEREFGVTLPEQRLMTAETPRDLLAALAGAAAPARAPPAQMPAAAEAAGAPEEAQTLPAVLEWHARRHPDRPHCYLYDDGGQAQRITYGMLAAGARAVAGGLRVLGLQSGQAAAIMLPTGRDYLYCFLGVLFAGGIPVPIYPPARPAQIEDHLRRHAGILRNALVSILITVPEAKTLSRLLRSQVENLRTVATVAELAGGQDGAAPIVSGAGDIALLQYTSGSTGRPKGVVLAHTNLLANIRAMGRAVRVDAASDVFVSWLPLYHDMGLIGAWLGSLYFACPLVLMSPLAFLARPERWLWAIHEHRGTLSAAPNFAFELCLNKIDDAQLAGLDLGSWRMAFNGAEPVMPETVERFTQRFARYGLRPECMAPVYGLAECSVGLAFPPVGRAPVIDAVRRDAFLGSGRAEPAAAGEAGVLRFVACGRPLPGHQIRIVDPLGRELPERQEGRLQFRGPSAASGYFRNPEETRRLFDGEWLDSGDLAYMAGGDAYLTSRAKDLIIRAGRNVYPHEIEEAVNRIPGIRKGCVAVFGAADRASGTERVVVLAETRETEPGGLERLRAQVNDAAADLMGTPPDEVVLAPPHTVLKTSSGKIRRAASRELYEQGRIGRRPRAVWWQVVRLAAAGLAPQWRRARRSAGTVAFAAYAWLLFAVLAPVTWVLVALTPRPVWRRALARRAARFLARLTGTPLRVGGTVDQLPPGPSVIVANHASYLDGMLLLATLPTPFTFVAKAELARSFISRVFLDRIDTVYVERFDKQRGVADARGMVGKARRGGSLLFFPEGTFTRMPGLLPFHMGAFVAAAEAGLPVVPVTIRGTRSILRADSWFPRRGAVSVTVGAPVPPAGRDWEAAVGLRDAARREILRHLGEPDLAEESPAA